MKFFKKVVIMKLKVCTTAKIFGKIYLKAIKDYKVRDGKEIAKSLMVFNLCESIHPFPSKKYLRTK